MFMVECPQAIATNKTIELAEVIISDQIINNLVNFTLFWLFYFHLRLFYMIIIFIQSINSQLLKYIQTYMLYSKLSLFKIFTEDNDFTFKRPSFFALIFINFHLKSHKTVSLIFFVFAPPEISSILFKNIICLSSIFCYFYPISMFFVTYWLIHTC